MNPGELRHCITIQKLDTITNENGFETEDWIDYKTVWAKIQNLHGQEYWAAKAVQSETVTKITIRYLKALDPAVNEEGPKTTKIYRLAYRGRILDIEFIDNIQYRNKYMEIKCREVV